MEVKKLVLTRKESQSITVDGPARFTIERVSGKQVKVVVEAVESTKILRDELRRAA